MLCRGVSVSKTAYLTAQVSTYLRIWICCPCCPLGKLSAALHFFGCFTFGLACGASLFLPLHLHLNLNLNLRVVEALASQQPARLETSSTQLGYGAIMQEVAFQSPEMRGKGPSSWTSSHMKTCARKTKTQILVWVARCLGAALKYSTLGFHLCAGRKIS